MRIMITGAAGNLGKALSKRLSALHTVRGADIIGDTELVLDITDYAGCRRLLQVEQPDLVIHTAAWTDVDACAGDAARALQINGIGTQNVAAAAARLGLPILYISTNEVFDGKSGQPYGEYDPPNPINAYAHSKWFGEQALQHINPRHYVVRTAWLFAHGGRNFIQAILGAAESGQPLRVVTNEIANPTYTEDLADAIVQLIETDRYGIYHFVNRGWASRWKLARYVLNATGYESTPIERISSQEWQRPSLPPEYTALANNAGASIGIVLRPWQEAVQAFLEHEGPIP